MTTRGTRRTPRRLLDPRGRDCRALPLVEHLTEFRTRLLGTAIALLAGSAVGYLLLPTVLDVNIAPYHRRLVSWWLTCVGWGGPAGDSLRDGHTLPTSCWSAVESIYLVEERGLAATTIRDYAQFAEAVVAERPSGPIGLEAC